MTTQNLNIKTLVEGSIQANLGRIPRDHQDTIDSVSADLQSSLDSAVTSLRRFATSKGLSPREVDQALVASGLVVNVPDPTPVVTPARNAPGAPVDLTRVETLIQRLTSVVERAERAAGRRF